MFETWSMLLIRIPEPLLSDQDIYNIVVNIKTAQLHLKHVYLFILTVFFDVEDIYMKSIKSR